MFINSILLSLNTGRREMLKSKDVIYLNMRNAELQFASAKSHNIRKQPYPVQVIIKYQPWALLKYCIFQFWQMKNWACYEEKSWKDSESNKGMINQIESTSSRHPKIRHKTVTTKTRGPPKIHNTNRDIKESIIQTIATLNPAKKNTKTTTLNADIKRTKDRGQ